jgi:3-methylcrotonyl-CoA carboxylase alpha subunit
MFRRLLIANRGEIACRIALTARRLGVRVIAVYSEADRDARHVRLADEAWPLGPAAPRASYLNVERLMEVARLSAAEALHPGYGFLSENEQLASACSAAGLMFVGPPAAAIAAMGSKAAAKAQMQRAGIAVLPGYAGEDQRLETLQAQGEALGAPLIIKPSGGGGGKGMQIVTALGQLPEALGAARRIAASAFGDSRLILERYVLAPRHVEVQVLADRQGRTLHLLDRDCSVQRRHQKLIEEAPAPQIESDVRTRLCRAACTVAREIGYVGAGTVEFLLEGAEFYFMEMNTRLQVEHPVTEAITGLDLVEWQLRIAAGERLTLQQSSIRPHGHAVEVRVCAEDPEQDFLPGAGTLSLALWPPAAPGIRVDQGFDSGDTVPPHYDSLLGKIIAHGASRAEAIERLRAALARTRIAGVPSNLAWLAAALDTDAFRAGPVSTAFLSEQADALHVRTESHTESTELTAFAAAAFVLREPPGATASPWTLGDGFRLSGTAPEEVTLFTPGERFTAQVHYLTSASVEVRLPGSAPVRIERQSGASSAGLVRLYAASGGEYVDAWVHGRHAHLWRDCARVAFERESLETLHTATVHAGSLTTTLPGVVVSRLVGEGERVTAGQPLLVIEAMKMEHTIRAPHAGIVRAFKYRIGERVKEGSTLVDLEAVGPDA